MLFSKTAKQAGGSGFFFDGDGSAPGDAIEVSNDDAEMANNLPAGAAFDFDANGKLVVTPAPVLTDAQVAALAFAAKWEAIKAERDRRTDQGGYKVGTKWFHSDQKSRSQQLGLVILGASIPANLRWKTMDGSFVTMTQALAEQIIAASAAIDQAIFAAAETHKAAMESNADPATYDFSAGWPETFDQTA